MHYPRYSFQHSVLVIGDLAKTQHMIRGGLLHYPVQFDFCPGDHDLAIRKIVDTKPDLLVVSLEFQNGSVIDFAKKTHKSVTNLNSIYLGEPHLVSLQNELLTLGSFEVMEHPMGNPGELIRKVEHVVQSLERAYRRSSAA